MQTYTVKEELVAYRNFMALDYSDISDEEKDTLIQYAKEVSKAGKNVFLQFKTN